LPGSGLVDGKEAEKFLYCSNLFRRANDWRSQLRDMIRQGSPVLDKLEQLRPEVERYAAEARRLEGVAKIMRNSDDVQQKFKRAVRRYKQAYERLEELNNQRKIFDGNFKAIERKYGTNADQIKVKCGGITWKPTIVARLCRLDGNKHRSFCLKLGWK